MFFFCFLNIQISFWVVLIEDKSVRNISLKINSRDWHIAVLKQWLDKSKLFINNKCVEKQLIFGNPKNPKCTSQICIKIRYKASFFIYQQFLPFEITNHMAIFTIGVLLKAKIDFHHVPVNSILLTIYLFIVDLQIKNGKLLSFLYL